MVENISVIEETEFPMQTASSNSSNWVRVAVPIIESSSMRFHSGNELKTENCEKLFYLFC